MPIYFILCKYYILAYRHEGRYLLLRYRLLNLLYICGTHSKEAYKPLTDVKNLCACYIINTFIAG